MEVIECSITRITKKCTMAHDSCNYRKRLICLHKTQSRGNPSRCWNHRINYGWNGIPSLGRLKEKIDILIHGNGTIDPAIGSTSLLSVLLMAFCIFRMREFSKDEQCPSQPTSWFLSLVHSASIADKTNKSLVLTDICLDGLAATTLPTCFAVGQRMSRRITWLRTHEQN